MVSILIKLSKYTEKISTPKYILIFIGFLLFMGYLSVNNITGTAKLQEISNGIQPLDMKFYYSPSEAYDTIKKLGIEGRLFYIKWLLMDFVVSFSTMLLHSTLISYLLKKLSSGEKIKKINLVPYVRGVFDYIENCLILIMIFNYPKVFVVVAIIANLMTIIKWILFSVSLAAVIILTIILSLKFLKIKHNITKSY